MLWHVTSLIIMLQFELTHHKYRYSICFRFILQSKILIEIFFNRCMITAGLAQSVERQALNLMVEGSSPSFGVFLPEVVLFNAGGFFISPAGRLSIDSRLAKSIWPAELATTVYITKNVHYYIYY